MPHVGTLVPAVVGAVVALLAAAPVAWAQAHPEAVVKPVGLSVKGPFVDRGDGVLWHREFRERGSAYVRLVFGEIQSAPGLAYTVTLRSGEDRVLARYSASQFGARPVLYTDVLPTDTVRVELEGKAPLDGLAFRIDALLRQVDLQGRTNALALVPDWRSVMDLSGVPEGPANLVTRIRESVAKIYMGSGAVCTAFLVSPSALLTNFHCLAESTEYQRTRTQPAASCIDIEAQFDFNGGGAPDAAAKARCQRVLKADEASDIALLEVDPRRVSPAKATRRPLQISDRAPAAAEELVVIHHPGGLAKKFSFACRAFPVNDGVVEHDCSTIPGSSGAALIARDGTVVGVHFAGPYDETLTVGEINAMVRRGHMFRNKARPAPVVRERLRGLLP